MRLRIVLWMPVFLAAALLIASVSFVRASEISCAQCGMMVDQASPFSARLAQGNDHLSFCDIGDMLQYFREHKSDPSSAEVKDYRTKAWLTASKAFYVKAPKKFSTPMGWGIAAFKDRSEAAGFGEPSDLTEIMHQH
jgi:copper chaperone NosL